MRALQFAHGCPAANGPVVTRQLLVETPLPPTIVQICELVQLVSDSPGSPHGQYGITSGSLASPSASCSSRSKSRRYCRCQGQTEGPLCATLRRVLLVVSPGMRHGVCIVS